MTDEGYTRRDLLRSGLAVGVTAVAGCSGASQGTTSPGATGSDAGSPSAAGGATAREATPGTGSTRATRQMTGESPTADQADLGSVRIGLETVAEGFAAPLGFAVPPGEDRRYVVDQPGRVDGLGPDGRADDPFLDLGDAVVTGGERGLLGLAFHPDYASNRRLYVRYSAPRRQGTPAGYSHTFVLAEFRATDDGTGVEPGSERTVLEIPEPQSNHNAGAIEFGPDGYLYVAVGDGGAGGDRGTGHVDDWYGSTAGGNGQDVAANLLGSVLRIDVDDRDGDAPYGIPDDNPLVGREGLDEHYAWGLRNPWRMSFDGDRLLVGDVGQNAREEVDVVERGGNYGWNVEEGTRCYGVNDCPDETPGGDPLIDPVIEYPHGGAGVSGVSVIGGYVYRGSRIPGLRGRYVFGDLSANGRLFVAGPTDEGQWPTAGVDLGEDGDGLDRLLSFGRDATGDLYALGVAGDGTGVVHRLVPA